MSFINNSIEPFLGYRKSDKNQDFAKSCLGMVFIKKLVSKKKENVPKFPSILE